MSGHRFSSSRDGLDTCLQMDQMGMGPGSLASLLGKGNTLLPKATGDMGLGTDLEDLPLGAGGAPAPSSSLQGAGQERAEMDDDNASFIEMEEAGEEPQEGEEQQDGHGHGKEEGQQEAEPERPLTVTLAMGINAMDTAISSIEHKIHELTQVGVARLDQIRDAFIAEMDRYIQDLRQVRSLQFSRWCELAQATIEESERLATAKALVGQLGIEAQSSTGGYSDGQQEQEHGQHQ